jgi:hypothetical protein
MDAARVTHVLQAIAVAVYALVSYGFLWLAELISDRDPAWSEVAYSVAWIVGGIPAVLAYIGLLNYVTVHPKASPNPRK